MQPRRKVLSIETNTKKMIANDDETRSTRKGTGERNRISDAVLCLSIARWAVLLKAVVEILRNVSFLINERAII